MKKERDNLLNLLLMVFHWLIADAAVALGFLFQLSFPKDPNPDAAIIFGKYYDLNIPLYILGTVILFVGYFLVWKLWLREDWLVYSGQNKGWTFAGIMVEIINLAGLFVLFFLIMVLSLHWGDYRHRWVNFSIFAILLALALLPLWFFKKKKEA